MSVHRNTLLIAKGPSAIQARIREGWDLACINESGALFPERVIRYTFFSDARMIWRAEPHWDRIEEFVMPSVVNRKGCPAGMEPRWIPLPRDRVTVYPHNPCDGLDATMERVLDETRGIYHHHTATAALHILTLAGYQQIHGYGFDGGGKGYAPGMQGRGDAGIDLDEWAEIRERFTQHLMERFPVQIRFYPMSLEAGIPS